jgi:hypothetical protein
MDDFTLPKRTTVSFPTFEAPRTWLVDCAL